jgi:predicted ATPase
MDEAQLLPGLGGLVDGGCLVAVPGRRAPAYRFPHPLLRDAAEAAILKARRRDLHSRIAEALSRAPQERAASPAAIAAHFTQAGDDKGAFL